jgi:dihydrofolate synthase/folylpolyglutamate synthase
VDGNACRHHPQLEKRTERPWKSGPFHDLNEHGAYGRLLARLQSVRSLGVSFGLDRVRLALERLGWPERRFRAVQIAGTNGKGSTAAFLESILRSAGLRTGLFTSPHLCRFSERIRIDGREVEGERLGRA